MRAALRGRSSIGARTRGEKGATVGRGPSRTLRCLVRWLLLFVVKCILDIFTAGGRKGVRERLAVFRNISLEESTRTLFLQAIAEKRPRYRP